MTTVSSADEQRASAIVTMETGNAAAGAESVASEPQLHPEMEKYMTIVLQQREKEKQKQVKQ